MRAARSIVTARGIREARLAGLMVLAAIVGCGDDAAPSPDGVVGSRAVVQGGAQDAAYFRELVAAGEVPSTDALDAAGFLAEHALDLPPADCGEPLCLHSRLAVAPKVGGGNWTMGYVAINTAIEPESRPRAPLHLVVVVEQSASTGSAASTIRRGLVGALAELAPDDRVTLVSFGETAMLHVTRAVPESDELLAAITGATELSSRQDVALYDGLATAYRAVSVAESARVLLLASGRADAGVTSRARLERLVSAHAASGIGLTAVGIGAADSSTVLRDLAERGAGTYSHAGQGELETLLRSEALTTLHPLALDLRLRLLPAPGYRLGRVHGVSRVARDPDGGATVVVPALFLGRRRGSSDVGSGRRGGGGAIFIELRADSSVTMPPGSAAFSAEAQWLDPASGETRRHQSSVANPLASGATPSPEDAVVSEPSARKAYHVINTYLGLRSALELEAAGDCRRAMGTLDLIAPMLLAFLVGRDDIDIEADLDLVLSLRDNLASVCSARDPVAPMGDDAACGWF